MRRLLHAEWLKLSTTRLFWGFGPAVVVVSSAAVAGATLSAESAGVVLESPEGIRRALHVAGTGAGLVLALGIVISAGEYRTQTATDTFLTTPSRWRVLLAKLVTGLLVGAVFGAVTAITCWGLATVLYESQGASFPMWSREVWESLAGAVVYSTLFGVLGVAFGSASRNQVFGVVGALAWLFVVEQVLGTFGGAFSKWLPGAAGQAIVRTPERELLEPLPAAALLTMYALLAAGVGLYLSVRRDA